MNTSVPRLVGKCLAGLALSYAALAAVGVVWWGRGDLDVGSEVA